MTTIRTIDVPFVAADDYSDIVSWLRIAAVMCSQAFEETGDGGVLPPGFLIAADRIVELEESLAEAVADAREWKRRATRNEQ